MESTCPTPPRRRFPWGYAAAVLMPFGAIAALLVADVRYGPRVTMGPAMVLACFMAPYCAAVIAWGVWRLQRGDGQTFPALRWLVWLPAAIAVLAVIGS